MLALGLVLNTLGIGLFCWAIFALAVYALPFFVALIIGMTALQSGAGVVGALLIGTTVGALTLVLGQTAAAVHDCRPRVRLQGIRRVVRPTFCSSGHQEPNDA